MWLVASEHYGSKYSILLVAMEIAVRGVSVVVITVMLVYHLRAVLLAQGCEGEMGTPNISHWRLHAEILNFECDDMLLSHQACHNI